MFTYDGLKRLVTSNLKGRFTKDTYEQFDMFRMNEIDRDIDGMASEKNATVNGQFFSADKVTLDEKGNSQSKAQAVNVMMQLVSLYENARDKGIKTYIEYKD